LRRAPVALSTLTVIAALGLSACGGSGGDAQGDSGSGSSSGRQNGGGPFAALQDKKVQACLKQQGVTVPTRPAGGQRPDGNGQPPSGYGPPQNGQPPSGDAQRPRGGFGGGFSDELRAALKKCGVDLPQGGQRAPGQTRTTTTTATT
jgi:hypothetical protein